MEASSLTGQFFYLSFRIDPVPRMLECPPEILVLSLAYDTAPSILFRALPLFAIVSRRLHSHNASAYRSLT